VRLEQIIKALKYLVHTETNTLIDGSRMILSDRLITVNQIGVANNIELKIDARLSQM